MEGFILLRGLTLQLVWYAHIFAWFSFVVFSNVLMGREKKKEYPWGLYNEQYSRIQKVIAPFVLLHVCFSWLLSGSYEVSFPFMG